MEPIKTDSNDIIINKKISNLSEELKKLLNEMRFSYNQLNQVPNDKHGIYAFFLKESKEPIYIGISINRIDGLRGRIKRHFQGKGFVGKIKESKKWARENCEFVFKRVEDKKETINLEHFAIAIMNPRYNDQINDLRKL